MWDKIGRFALEAGKFYVEKRGVDGVKEDANKVFNLAKKGASNIGNMFASDNAYNEYQEITDESTLNYEYLDEYAKNIILEVQSGIKEAKRLNVLSKEFTDCARRALCTGYVAMSDLFSLENEITESDFDILIEKYITPIDTECDKLLMLIKQKCKGGEESPVSYNQNKLNDSFTMEVHGVYPINFDISCTLLVGVIKAGRIKINDDVLLDKEKGISGKITYIAMFGKVLEEAEVGDVCAISVLGDYLSCLPEEVFVIGTETENKEVATSINEVSENEKEYIESYQECLTDDNEISDRERRVLNRLRDSLGISEKRAMELEAQCNPSILSNEEREYLEEFKACMEDGVISDRERRLLDRLAKSLNISSERVAQIENTSL